ncbi:hypothetical protein ACROYT_G014384 [Oculina patagonica]
MRENNYDGEDGTEKHSDISLLDSEGELVSGQRSLSRFPLRTRSYEKQKTLKGFHTDTCNHKGKQPLNVRVVQWAVCIEGHHNTDVEGEELNQYHYHMAIKLAKRYRWFQGRKHLEEHFGIKVNFSDSHNSYYSAYCYVTKEDKEEVRHTLIDLAK